MSNFGRWKVMNSVGAHVIFQDNLPNSGRPAGANSNLLLTIVHEDGDPGTLFVNGTALVAVSSTERSHSIRLEAVTTIEMRLAGVATPSFSTGTYHIDILP